MAGLDMRPPAEPIEGMHFIEADLRDQVIATLIPQEEVDVVVHNQIVRRPGPGHVRAQHARHQRDRHAAAAGGVRALGHHPARS